MRACSVHGQHGGRGFPCHWVIDTCTAAACHVGAERVISYLPSGEILHSMVCVAVWRCGGVGQTAPAVSNPGILLPAAASTPPPMLSPSPSDIPPHPLQAAVQAVRHLPCGRADPAVTAQAHRESFLQGKGSGSALSSRSTSAVQFGGFGIAALHLQQYNCVTSMVMMRTLGSTADGHPKQYRWASPQ